MRSKHSCAALGFTLIELMIVILIVAILTTACFKIYGAVIMTTKKAKALQQVHAIATAAEEYFNDFKCYPPDTDIYKSGLVPPNGIAASDMKYCIHRYLGLALIDKQTGVSHGPYLRNLDNNDLKGEEKVIDGRAVKIYSDPFWKPGEDDKHAYELFCKHFKRDLERNVTVVMPYDDSTPEDQRVLDVKAWSRGPDGKSTPDAPFFPTIMADENKDNIMSWTKGK